MSDDIQPQADDGAGVTAPPPDPLVTALQGPDGGPDDGDAVHDLSGFPDLTARTFRWRD